MVTTAQRTTIRFFRRRSVFCSSNCMVGPLFTSPDEVRRFLQVKLAALEHEVFAVLMLDCQRRSKTDPLATGTPK